MELKDEINGREKPGKMKKRLDKIPNLWLYIYGPDFWEVETV